MPINWDPIINGAVLVLALIWIICLVTKQTLPELIQSIKDIINGTGDDALEKGEELLYYDWRNDRTASARVSKADGW